MPTDYDDLLPFKWRDNSYPCTRIRLTLAHDLVEHKYWRVNAARVEDTGVAPIRISAELPISNRVVPGKAEKWKAGKLFPTALRALLVDFATRSAGLLQHPEFGRIACKAERIDFELAADRRDGPVVTASWVETIDDDVITEIVNRPVVDIGLEAANLDAEYRDLKRLVPSLPEYQTDFEDFARAIQGIGDQIALLSSRTVGQIDRLAYRINNVQASIERAKSALTWPATQAIERLKSATNDLRETLLVVGRDLQIFTVPVDTTLAGLQAMLPASTSLSDLIKMNPVLVVRPVVPKGTRVRHYVDRIAA
jgi:prophage DNA circulation protein